MNEARLAYWWVISSTHLTLLQYSGVRQVLPP